MGFIDGIRLAELAAEDDEGLGRAGLHPALVEELAKPIGDRTAWLQSVTRELRPRIEQVSDPRAAALLGQPTPSTPRRRYRPPAGLEAWLTRWLGSRPSAERAALEIAELEGTWAE